MNRPVIKTYSRKQPLTVFKPNTELVPCYPDPMTAGHVRESRLNDVTLYVDDFDDTFDKIMVDAVLPQPPEDLSNEHEDSNDKFQNDSDIFKMPFEVGKKGKKKRDTIAAEELRLNEISKKVKAIMMPSKGTKFKKKGLKSKENNENVNFLNKVIELEKSAKKSKDSQQKSKKVSNKTKTSPLKSETKTQMKECTIAIERCDVSTIVNEKVPTIINKSNQSNPSCKENNDITSFIEEFENPRKISSINYLDVANSLPTSTPREHKLKMMVDMQHISPIKLDEKYEENIKRIDMKEQSNQNLFIEEPDLKSTTRLSPKIIDTFVNLKSRTSQSRVHRDSENNSHINNRSKTLDATENKVSSIEDNNEDIESFHNSLITNEIKSSNMNENSNSLKQFSILKRNTNYRSLHLTPVTTEPTNSFVESPLLFDDTKDNQSQEDNTLILLRKNNENSVKDILIFENSGNSSKGKTDNKNQHFNSTQNESSYYPDEWTNDYNSSYGYTTNDDIEQSMEKPDNTTTKSSNLCDEKSSINQNSSHSYNEKNYFNSNETNLKSTILVETSMSQESEPNSTSKIPSPNTTHDENTEVDESPEDESICTQLYTRKRKYSEQSNESQNKELILHLSTSNDENTDNESPALSKKVLKRRKIDKTIKKLNFTLTSIDELQDDQISDEGSEPNVTCESIVDVETKLNNTSQNDNLIDKLTKHTKFDTTNMSENITSSISRNTKNNQIDQIEREEKIINEISDNNDSNIIIQNNIIHNGDQIHNSTNATGFKNVKSKRIDNKKINEIQHNETTVGTINKDRIISKNAFDNHNKTIESDNGNQMNEFIDDNEKGTNELNNEELLLPVFNFVDNDVENQSSKGGKKSIKKNLKNRTKKVIKAKAKNNKIVKNMVNMIANAGNMSTEFDTNNINQITSDNLDKLDSVIINQIPHQQIKLKELRVLITKLNLPIKKNKSHISLQETITPKKKKDISNNSKSFIENNVTNNENNDDYRNHQNNVNNDKEKIDAHLERNKITGKIEENSEEMDMSNKSFNGRELCVLLSKLNDPVKITLKRDTYKKWDKPLAVISENLVESPNITSHREINEECLNEETNNKADKIINDTSIEKRETSESIDNYTSLPIFLKPGKSWARSLSIINHFHNGQNLEEMAIGRGKNWRHSVQDVLDMQPEGVTQNSTNHNNEEQERGTQHYLRLSEIPQKASNRISRVTISPSRSSRPFSMRIIPSGTRSTLTDTFNSERGSSSTNVTRKTSIPRKTSLRMQRDTLIETEDDLIRLAKDIILKRCKQRSYLPFDVCFPDSYIENCRKIGEGVYGEVFLYDDGLKKSVIKIIPIEGEELVNSEPQKKFHEILSEIIIAEELHKLKFGDEFRTTGFVGLNRIKCVIGKYPNKLIDLWKAYDRLKFSENDCPSMFGDEQLYIILDLAHGGQDLEAYEFQNASESYSIFLQAAYTLAVAEQSLQFEHRDLHWGNVLISKTDDKVSSHKLGSGEITLPTNGVKVSVIDFTLSRMSYKGCKIFNDLAADPTLFEAKGEYQFDIYRMMRDSVNNDWQQYNPYTNVLWLDYTLDKMITAARYKKKTTKIHKTAIEKMKQLRKEILDYKSTFDFVTKCKKIKIVTK